MEDNERRMLVVVLAIMDDMMKGMMTVSERELLGSAQDSLKALFDRVSGGVVG